MFRNLWKSTYPADILSLATKDVGDASATAKEQSLFKTICSVYNEASDAYMNLGDENSWTEVVRIVLGTLKEDGRDMLKVTQA